MMRTQSGQHEDSDSFNDLNNSISLAVVEDSCQLNNTDESSKSEVIEREILPEFLCPVEEPVEALRYPFCVLKALGVEDELADDLPIAVHHGHCPEMSGQVFGDVLPANVAGVVGDAEVKVRPE
jgi:hypothetical protein